MKEFDYTVYENNIHIVSDLLNFISRAEEINPNLHYHLHDLRMFLFESLKNKNNDVNYEYSVKYVNDILKYSCNDSSDDQLLELYVLFNEYGLLSDINYTSVRKSQYAEITTKCRINALDYEDTYMLKKYYNGNLFKDENALEIEKEEKIIPKKVDNRLH